jgi:hypothetical protein
MNAILKALTKEIEKERLQSGNAYAQGFENVGRKHEYIATGLEQAYRILISELVASK